MARDLELYSVLFDFHRCCFIVSQVLYVAWWVCSPFTIYKNSASEMCSLKQAGV